MLLYRVVSRTTYNHLECAPSSGLTAQVAGLTPGSLRPSSSRSFTFSDDDETTRGFVLSTRSSVDTQTSTPLPSSTSTSAGTTAGSSGTGTGTANSANANPATSTSSGAAAVRTAEAVFGIGGGVVGLLAILL